MNKIMKLSAFALLSISITACSEAAVKDASLDNKNEKDLPPIHEDYSSNWWKDQPNGNADTNMDWDAKAGSCLPTKLVTVLPSLISKPAIQ
ncbi:hypothetical protein [Mesobacillus boroniphilus]|uniref:Uncharacterized protein n=1 Tax=Mesobacillus boroniphilus JCM 21738 TaxID=1294265 RepID=W4RJE1_9BACI|nr:hypothetical protein [Mesobacillus boroniphilus]GAE44550.1 hypothetical protein JCM21738_1270 [Mesobacillus boroniphilus JCM 21738]